jgi:deoxyribose-phosphate aldolase
MNVLEYGYYDPASDEKEIKENIAKAISYSVDVVSLLPSYLRCAKNIVKDKSTLSAVIDYLFGLSCINARKAETENALKSGAKIIELVAPNHALCNKKYDKFRKDINEQKDLCDRHDAELRYIIDYRTYTEYMQYKICSMAAAHQVDTVYPSNNYMLDNILDNLIASMLLSKKIPHMNVIVNGNAWSDKHVQLILKNPQIYGYKTNNIYTLEKLVYNTNVQPVDN